MSDKLLFCKNCRNNLTPKFYGYWPGGYNKDNKTCPVCKIYEMTELNFKIEDYYVIRHTSKDVNFLEAMIKLHDEDIIEYETRMSQFRANDPWYQEKYNPKQKEDNVPKCPHCHSANIKPISGSERAVSIIGLGLFSKKINKSFKCLDCKYTW